MDNVVMQTGINFKKKNKHQLFPLGNLPTAKIGLMNPEVWVKPPNDIIAPLWMDSPYLMV